MATMSELQKELERWKDKYFEQGESFDEQKRLLQEYASIMQRILVRVSLAAEHTSEDLDSELASLRSAVRNASPEKNDLESRLKRIDKIILATDEHKLENLKKVSAALDTLVAQLQELDLQRKQKSALKKLSKSIAKHSSNIQEYPSILSEYARVQSEVLSEISEPQKKEAGFLSRLLGTQKTDSGRDETDEIAPLSEDELELETEETANTEEELVPGFSSVARHIRETLGNLLDQLSFPTSATREVAKLRGQIDKELVWYELGPTLDDVANLILSVVGKGQREFGSFLKVLDERLSKVQDFLRESQNIDESWQTQNEQFDQQMRDRVDEMTQQVDSAADISDLKRSISDHLDSISSAVDQHATDAESHKQAKSEEVAALKERIKEMEEETRYIRQRLKEERDKALKDSLTGLPNRESYDERFELELERYKRYGNPATVAVADIDFFKSINDNYGHLSGDKVLQIIAKEIQKRIRKTDFVARYGGEEFVILLPETDLETAREVIDKVRDMISRLPFHFRDEKIQITMSFGLCEFSKGASQDELFGRADTVLYRAKENGRNRVEIWTSEDEEG